MSTNEELFADVKEYLAHNVWDDEIFVLADRLVTAFEQVTVERDEAREAAEDNVLNAEATYERMAEKLRKVTVERDEAWRVAGEQTRMERDRAEKAEAERDELLQAITELEPLSAGARIKRLEQTAEHTKLACDRLRDERDALAAVVEQVRQYADQIDPSNLDEQPMWPVDVRKILDEAPSAALDRVKAEALREAADGFRLYGDHDYSAVTMVTVENYLNDRADRIEKGESND